MKRINDDAVEVLIAILNAACKVIERKDSDGTSFAKWLEETGYSETDCNDALTELQNASDDSSIGFEFASAEDEEHFKKN